MAKIEVSLTPMLYPVYQSEGAIVVMIDILRASSAICTAFESGVEKIIPVATREEAEEYKSKGYMVGAERGGEQLPGFDFGNSPYSYMKDNIKGKTIVLTTTNGTKAIAMAKDAYKLVVGAFTNFTALCSWLEEENRDVLLLCAGWKNRFNLEDTLFAGAVTERLSEHMSFTDLADSALASKYLYQKAMDDPFLFLNNSSHRKRLARLNLKEDIKYCLSFDKTSIIPVLENDCLVRMG